MCGLAIAKNCRGFALQPFTCLVEVVESLSYLITNDGARVGYGFDGTMIDREGWQRGRIAAGDIRIMRSITESKPIG